jgi:RNA polymerase sigma-70 factor (ECF subfamily)
MTIKEKQNLLTDVREYNLDILADIYDQYSPGIYNYAMRLLGDDTLAEDCVAETFSRFLKVIRNGQGPCDHLQAYLYRIAHNLITDSYRRQPPPPLELDENLRAEEQSKPEIQADISMEKERVRLAMRSLTPDQRQVVMLRFMEELDIEDVAQAMNKPVSAIKALQHRALAALRRLLPREEGGIYGKAV